ncbi:MAG: hypothetical protein QOC92_3525, partial [Acidimicrobiaceae bacterium]
MYVNDHSAVITPPPFLNAVERSHIDAIGEALL